MAVKIVFKSVGIPDMDEIKVENFLKTHSLFPTYEKLSINRCREMFDLLKTSLDCDKSVDALELMIILDEQSTALSIDAEDPQFGFIKVLSEKALAPNEDVFINWYRFDETDQMSAKELDRYSMIFGIRLVTISKSSMKHFLGF